MVNVHNAVNVPEQAPPVVNVEAVMPELQVNATLPARKTTSTTEHKRDAAGNIVSSSTSSTESNA